MILAKIYQQNSIITSYERLQALILIPVKYRRSLESDLHSAYEEEAAALALISTTKDRLEGVQSFIERRPPEFQGD